MIIDCQECHQRVEAHEAGSFERVSGAIEPRTLITLLSCLNCGAPILVKRVIHGSVDDGEKWDDPQRLFPVRIDGANPNTPKEVLSAFAEANMSCDEQDYTNALTMCRKALLNMAEAHEITNQPLGIAMRSMRELGVIDDWLLEWWDSLPAATNEGVVIRLRKPTRREIIDILEFTSATMDYLFSCRRRFAHFKRRQWQQPNSPRRIETE